MNFLKLFATICMLCPPLLSGATPEDSIDQNSSPSEIDIKAEIVTYSAIFFAQYQPLTALDMVKQVPGFQLDDGEELRGFGSAAGNILIDNNRPSAKQDLVSAILARIPAANVERIDLIRGQVQDINMQGHSIVVNVIMTKDNVATNRWESFVTYTSPAPLGLGGNISMSNQWNNIDYNFGIDIERDTNGIKGTVERFDNENNLTQLRVDKRKQTGIGISGIFLNASTLLGETLYNLNTKIGFREGDGRELSHRIPQTMGDSPFDIIFENSDREPEIEIGFDGERLLNENLQGKGILVFTHSQADATDTQKTFDNNDEQISFKKVIEETDITEVIGRVELDWSGMVNHAITIDIEAAYNILNNGLELTEDTGMGPEEIFVPNGNSRVEEVRGEFLFKDTWTIGNLTWDYGLGAEVSTITQTGDTDQKRSFFFIKPQSLLSWSPNQQQQTRLRIEREVSQLNFNDFVSTTSFVDDDLALGNPDLKPETTWITEFSHERRFGKLGVVTLTVFHHWIVDVLDLLPVSDEFEVPGNIGNGRRWGLEMKTTLPLTWLNIKGARLDVQTRWQDSKVTDPVTGSDRQLSAFSAFPGPPTIRFYSENDYVVDIAFRQDFEDAKWAWGFDTAVQADRAVFKVNELENFEEGIELNAFFETTRYPGMKIRLEGRNLTNYLEVRDRFSYSTRRDLSPISGRERRLRKPNRIFTITFSGNF
ncbi:MAG: TonB-dependent receptor domain-containing protein [Gammaproteobacteria bacterium]|jgi:outer membrane receptor protein involved in Fe transport